MSSNQEGCMAHSEDSPQTGFGAGAAVDAEVLEALRKSERLLRVAQKAGRIGCYTSDLVRQTWQGSQVLDDLLGIGQDYPRTMQGWLDLMAPDQREATAHLFRETIQGSGHLECDYRIIRPCDGQELWLSHRADFEPDEDGHITRMIGTVQDITERKRAEIALQQRLLALTSPLAGAGEVRLEDLFNLEELQAIQDALSEATGVAAIITDPEGRPITRQSGFCRLCEMVRRTEAGLANCYHSDAVLGVPRAAEPVFGRCLSAGLLDGGASITAGGQHIANWLFGQVLEPEQDPEALVPYAERIGVDPEAFRQALAEVPRMTRERFQRVARAIHLVAAQLSRLALQNLQQAKLIRSRQEAEADLAMLNRELEARVHARTARMEEANQELEAFSYSVSHDLRAPLRRIEGFAQLLGEEWGERLDPEGRACLDRVVQGTRHMGMLIQDLLKLSRVSQGDLARERLDLTEAARTILAELAQAHPDRAVQVEVAPGLQARGDGRLVSIMLQNLLANAWKYTSRTPQGRIEVGVHGEPGGPAFFVQDNGCGFDMAHANRLFHPFQRLHSDRDFEGNGIGLAIVHRVVHRHGGRIWAEAEPGRGAAFHFTLPDV